MHNNNKREGARLNKELSADSAGCCAKKKRAKKNGGTGPALSNAADNMHRPRAALCCIQGAGFDIFAPQHEVELVVQSADARGGGEYVRRDPLLTGEDNSQSQGQRETLQKKGGRTGSKNTERSK
jgi:hypothetical protein